MWQAYYYQNISNAEVKTTVNVYHDEPVVYFTIEYTNGLTKASIPDTNYHTLSSFPSFVLEETDTKRASLTWARGSKFNSDLSNFTKGRLII